MEGMKEYTILFKQLRTLREDPDKREQNMNFEKKICEIMRKELKITSNGHLTPQQRGLATSIRLMVEDHLYFCFIHEAYVHEEGKHTLTHYPETVFGKNGAAKELAMKTVVKKHVSGVTHAQGIGRHSKEEVRGMGVRCLESISQILGEQEFLFGSQICDEDCAVFGMLVWILTCVPEDNYFNIAVREDFSNLVRYVDRIKALLWEDWDEKKLKKTE